MRDALAVRYKQLKSEGRKDEASALYKRFKQDYLRWAKAIENAGDDSPAIPFSKYFKLD